MLSNRVAVIYWNIKKVCYKGHNYPLVQTPLKKYISFLFYEKTYQSYYLINAYSLKVRGYITLNFRSGLFTAKPSSSSLITLTSFLHVAYNQALFFQQDARKSDRDSDGPYGTFHEPLRIQ